jgi:hypothetical protein
MTYVVRDGAVYRKVASPIEVSYEALSDEGKFMVDLWLRNSGKQPGTPEYEEYKKKAIQRALETGEVQDLTQRVNVADAYEDTPLDLLAEAKQRTMEAHLIAQELVGNVPQELVEKIASIKNMTKESAEWMTRLAKMLGYKG